MNLRLIRNALKNPLVVASLILGVIGAPPLYYSGLVGGLWGVVLFFLYILIATIDGLIVLALIVDRNG